MTQDKVFFQTVGNVGRDPVTKTLPSGDVITSFSLAVSNGYGNPREGTDAPAPTWIDVTVWREQLQELVADQVYKGSTIAVEGTLSKRESNGNTYRDLRASKIWLCAQLKPGAAQPKEW